MMEGWEEVKLSELTKKIGSGVTPRGGSSVYKESGTALFRSQNIYNGSFSSQGLVFIDSVIADKMKNVTVQPNDVLLNITGDSVARCCSVPEDYLPARVNQHVAIIRPEEQLVNSRFLMYNLISPKMQATLLAFASGAGATRNALTKSVIGNIKINLPPLPTQRKIAAILSAYDDLIENNLKRIKLLEEKAQLTYEEWFVRMKFPGHETTPINEETGLPEGWEKRKIKEIANFQNGYAFYTKGYSDNGFAVIDLANVSERGDLNITGKEKFISEELYKSLPKFHLQKYDLIVAMTDVTSALRILAKSAIIDKDNTYALNQRVGRLRPNTDLFDYSFLYALLSDIRFIERMKAMSKGAVQFYFNTKDIVNYETFIPKKEVIDEFVKHYQPLIELRMKLKDQNQLLKEARDILLPRLMTGMINVEELDVKLEEVNG